MKIIWAVINFIQITIICLWTAVCAVVGVLLMLITWNGAWVHKVNGLYLWSPLVCALCGVRVTLHGSHHINTSLSRIYVANHASHFDIVALARVMPVGLFFIAKKELARVPFMGQYMRLIGHIFIDRKNKDKSMESMMQAAEKIKRGRNVISFPEGTRSKTDEVQIFKRGSFIIAKQGNVDIVPIGISGSRSVLPSGRFGIRPGTITVRVGEAISAEQFAQLNVEQLAELAREKVEVLIKENRK
ncbi:MAG: lysophospholipid acyltransferase family protein [Flavobacteriales bacterium]